MILAKFSSAKRRDVRSRVDVSLARIREVRVSHGFVGRFAARRRRESRRVLAGAGRVCRSGAAGGSRRAARRSRRARYTRRNNNMRQGPFKNESYTQRRVRAVTRLRAASRVVGHGELWMPWTHIRRTTSCRSPVRSCLRCVRGPFTRGRAPRSVRAPSRALSRFERPQCQNPTSRPPSAHVQDKYHVCTTNDARMRLPCMHTPT